MELNELFNAMKGMSADDLKQIENMSIYYQDVEKLKGLILSMIVPTNLETEDMKDRPDYLFRIQNGENNFMDIGYDKNRKEQWKNILKALAEYYDMDLSDILDSNFNFRAIHLDNNISIIDGKYQDTYTHEFLSEEDVKKRRENQEEQPKTIEEAEVVEDVTD